MLQLAKLQKALEYHMKEMETLIKNGHEKTDTRLQNINDKINKVSL